MPSLPPTISNGSATQEDTTSQRLDHGRGVRYAARSNDHTSPTSGLAPSYLQANLIVLPSRYAADFRALCSRNPVPCPLLAESSTIGSWVALRSWITGLEGSQIASDIDMRKDAPRYNVYKDLVLAKNGCLDIASEWTDDHVGFLIGCSYSFESALTAQGLAPRHVVKDRNVSMYRTNIPLCAAGVFTGATYVVSMRPYKASEIEQVRNITREYSTCHGEPIAWGWDAVKRLGIKSINTPEWGDAPVTTDGRLLGEVEGDETEVPVFWGCGVTPQEALMRANLYGTVMAHSPGHMIVLDCKDTDITNHANNKM